MADGTRTVTLDLVGRDRSASRTMDKVGASSDRAGRRVSGFGRTFSKVGVGLTRTAGVAGAAMVGLGVAGGIMGLKTAAGLEQAQIGFETMLGSGKKAQRFLTKLKKFAAATPFNLPGLIDNSRMLIGVGVSAKKTIPFLTDFGDAAGALGIKQDGFNRIILAMSQSISSGKIKLGDMNQLMNNGLPIYGLLSKALHKPVPEIQSMITHGKLLTKDVLPKLQRQMHKDYGGAMQKQSQTLNGLWSTFMDTLNLGLADVMKPLAGWLKKVMPGAIKAMSDALKKIPGVISKIKDFAGPIVAKIKDALPKIKTALKAWASAAADVFNFVKVDVVPIVAQIASAAAAASKAIITGIKTGLATGDWSALGGVLSAGVGRAAVAALKGGSFLVDALKNIDWRAVGVKAAFVAVPFVAGFISGLTGALARYAADNPMDVVNLILLLVPVGRAAKFAKLGAEKIGLPFIGRLLGVFAWGGRQIEKLLGFMFRGFVKIAERIMPGVVIAVRNAIEYAKIFVVHHGVDFLNAGKRLMAHLASGIGHGVDDVVVGVRLVIRKALAPFKTAGRWLLKAGADMVRGFISGIGSMAGAAKDAATRMAKGAVDSAKSLLHIGSPSKVFIAIGEFVSKGFAVGIRKGGKHAIQAMKDLIDAVRSKLGDLQATARDIATSAADSVKGILDVSQVGAQGTSPRGVLAGFAAQAKAFAAALARMARKHFAPAIIAAVAAAGPSALGAANAFASESASGVRADNAASATIDRAARSAGATVLASTSVPKQLAETNHLLRQLIHATSGERVVKSFRITKGGDLVVEYVNKKNHVAGRRGHQ